MKATRLRVVHGLALAVVFAFCAGGLTPRTASAEGDDLRSALDDYAAGRADQALEKLRAYVAGNPEQEEVYSVIRDVEQSLLLNAMAKGGEHEQLIKYLLRQSQPVEQERMNDEDAIRDTVAKAVESSDFAERRAAALSLRRAGARAVPYLVGHLGSEDSAVVTNAIIALREIYSDGTLPLVEALESDNARVRAFAAAVLGHIGDERARPALQRALGDEDENVRAKAEGALVAMGGAKGNAADAYVALGNRYYSREPGTVRAFADTMDIWRWNDGNLERYEVPAWLFGAQMAEECAADALALDASHRGAASLLVRSILRQRAEADGLAARGEEAPESLAGAMTLAKGLGFQAASDALADSLETQDWDVAVGACDLVAATYGQESLAGHPIGAALDSAEQRVRFAAAIAALHMSPTAGFPNADKVAALASQAAASGAIRQVLVIDDVDATRNKAVMALEAAGFVTGGEAQGFIGANRAKMAPTLDVILIRANLGENGSTMPSKRLDSSLMVIDELTRDARTKDMRIVVLLDEGSEAKNAVTKEFLAGKYGDKVAAFIEAPLVEAVVASEVGAAAEAADLGPDRERANATAVKAAMAFAGTDTGCNVFDLSSAVGPLATAVTSGPTDDIKQAAVKALGNLRAGGADALTQALTEGDDAMKLLAAEALGNVLSVLDGSEAQVAALMEAAGAEGDLGTTALKALGQVRNLTPGQRLEVFRRHRLQVASKAE